MDAPGTAALLEIMNELSAASPIEIHQHAGIEHNNIQITHEAEKAGQPRFEVGHIALEQTRQCFSRHPRLHSFHTTQIVGQESHRNIVSGQEVTRRLAAPVPITSAGSSGSTREAVA